MRPIRVALLVALASLVAGSVAPSGGAGAQNELSGDEILERASREGSFTQRGSQISRVRFELLFTDGKTGMREFAFFAKRDEAGSEKLLIYFLRPELECGTAFLSHDSADPEEETRLWLLLPALGQVKELVSEADRNASFAGSNFENDQIGGGFDLHEDYRGELEGEERVGVSWLGRTQERLAYVVSLEQWPEAEVDFPTGTAWIDEQEFIALRIEFENAAAKLEQVLTLAEFVEFEDDIVPNRLEAENVLEGSRTTVRIEERRRPESDLPDAIFMPENLKEFNPEEFGVDSPCVP